MSTRSDKLGNALGGLRDAIRGLEDAEYELGVVLEEKEAYNREVAFQKQSVLKAEQEVKKAGDVLVKLLTGKPTPKKTTKK